MSFRCISHSFAVYMVLRARTGQRLMNFHSKLLKSPSIYVSSIKYYSFETFLLTCRSLGTKKGQTLMNSERDTHLYSYFCTCTNMSFRCISHSFTENCIKFLQLRFQPLNISSFQKDTFVQVQKELYKCVSLFEFINLWPVLAPRAIDCDRSV